MHCVRYEFELNQSRHGILQFASFYPTMTEDERLLIEYQKKLLPFVYIEADRVFFYFTMKGVRRFKELIVLSQGVIQRMGAIVYEKSMEFDTEDAEGMAYVIYQDDWQIAFCSEEIFDIEEIEIRR
jgi:hypothetical protein